MNHGGIGYLSYKRILLPVDLIRPLSIGDGSLVLAMHYPRPNGDQYKNAPDVNDLMITPIPLRYWPVMGRLLVRLQHRQGTMAAVACWLRDQNISILNAECSRSAHRWATWNLTIAFDDLINKPNEYDSKSSEHKETRKALDHLETELENAFCAKNILFRDENDAGLMKAVESVPVRAHSYFYDYMINNSGQLEAQPFELYCSHAQLHSRDGHLGAFLDQLAEGGDELAPTCVVAEMDTRDFNIRAAIIPPSDLHRFFEIVLPYRRSGGQSTRGLIARVTKSFSDRYNIWRLFNTTSQNGKDIEIGETFLCLEDIQERGGGRFEYRKRLKLLIETIRNEFHKQGPEETKILPQYQINPITAERIRSRLTEERIRLTGRKYDVFISYGKRDGKRSARAVRMILEDQGISTHLDEEELNPGEDWQERLIQGIKLSSEVAVVCTRRSLNRPWIAIEIGCAMGLEKKVTPILCGDIDENEVPEYLQRFQWVVRRKDHNLKGYVKSVFKGLAQAANRS